MIYCMLKKCFFGQGNVLYSGLLVSQVDWVVTQAKVLPLLTKLNLDLLELLKNSCPGPWELIGHVCSNLITAALFLLGFFLLLLF